MANCLSEQVDTGRQIAGELLLTYVAQAEGRSRGKIWPDEKTKTIQPGHWLCAKFPIW